jgi:hypothetical protein
MNKLDTPRTGKAWCDTVNTTPMPKTKTRNALSIGTVNLDGTGFVAHKKPIERLVLDTITKPTGSYLWLGDLKL